MIVSKKRRPAQPKPLSVSVVIPAYNCAATLPGTLDSVATQTRRPLEILICDDGSTDGTWEYLESLGTNYRGIKLKVLHQTNAGAGAARNHCIAAAKGDLIAFVDADDQWLPKKLARSVEVLEAGNYTFVAHDFYAVNAHNQKTLWPCAQNSQRRDWLNRGDMRTHYYYRGFVGILTVVMRREALLAAGGFHGHERYGLDWECWHALFAAMPNATFTVFAEPLALYALSPTGLTSKAFARLREREIHLARYARMAAAHARATVGGPAGYWPLLFTRGWLTLQYEAASVFLKTHQPENLAKLLLRAPFAWAMLMARIFRNADTQRPDFLS
ncbi:MAG: glycosyltransferase family 2 protein [Pseudomonadaceae bacterium]|nr:glycosyltransferase family 2 protein [Pseudomonadaceae bacterium]